MLLDKGRKLQRPERTSHKERKVPNSTSASRSCPTHCAWHQLFCGQRPKCFSIQKRWAHLGMPITFWNSLSTCDCQVLSASCDARTCAYVCVVCVWESIPRRCNRQDKSRHKAVKVLMRWNPGSGNHNTVSDAMMSSSKQSEGEHNTNAHPHTRTPLSTAVHYSPCAPPHPLPPHAMHFSSSPKRLFLFCSSSLCWRARYCCKAPLNTGFRRGKRYTKCFSN